MGASLVVTIAGWWAWNLFLSAVYPEGAVRYAVKHSFTETFGADLSWWIALVANLAVLCVAELTFKAVKRYLVVEGLWKWPPWKVKTEGCESGRPGPGRGQSAEEWSLELWQELEQIPAVMKRMRLIARFEDGDVETREVLQGEVDLEMQTLDLRNVMKR